MTWPVDVLSPPPPPPSQYYPPPVPTGKWIALACWVLIILLAGTILTRTTMREYRELSVSNTDPPSMQFEIPGKFAVVQAVKASGSTGKEHDADVELTERLAVTAGESAKTPAERLALVPVLYECRGKNAAVEQLNKERPFLAAAPALSADADLLEKIYAGGPDSISADDRQRLDAGLGWFGKLALTEGRTGPDPARAALLLQSQQKEAGLVALVGGLVTALLLGVAALITAIVLLSLGLIRPGMVRPPTGGPPRLLVLFTIWIYGFMGLSILLQFLPVELPLLVHELIAVTWTALVVVTPAVRGGGWAQWRQTLGLHTGGGIFIEMLCGVGGYLAGLPLLAAALVVVIGLSKLSNVRSNHPIVEQFTGPMSAVKFLGLFFLLSVMAPVVEETVFRGALYGHMRRRWNPLVSAGAVSLIFAAIHPQGWEAIPVLASIAFVLAMLREWRGSLVASITAHGLNNFVALVVGVTLAK